MGFAGVLALQGTLEAVRLRGTGMDASCTEYWRFYEFLTLFFQH